MTGAPGSAEDPSELITVQDAADLLGVAPEQVHVMVQDGLLDPAETDGGEPRFVRAEVAALRQLGG